MPSSTQPTPRQGQPIIEEAARILGQLRFSEHRGAYVEGRRVAISVDPRWNADHETVRVLVTCYPLGHRRTDWTALPIQVRPDSGASGVYAFARLDARGQATIPQLPPGRYRLSLRLTPSQTTPVLSQRIERLAAKELEEQETERQVWQGAGEDDAILWTLEETEEGEIQIAFETSDERFANSTIVFHLLDPASRQVQYSQRIMLAPTRTPGKWEGWRALGFRVDFAGPYELIFEATPADEEA